jgi:hypothetical protein
MQERPELELADKVEEGEENEPERKAGDTNIDVSL